MFSLLRVLFAVAYLGGTFIHLYNGARQPQVYRAFGDTALVPGFKRVWSGLFMPAAGRGRDFLINRLPNLLLAAVQLPLLGMELRTLGGCREVSET